jgi:glycosyltransferase involved in cell wall biosynthesis
MTDVLVLTRYERLGASSRVRFLQFLPELERNGFNFDVRPLFDDAYVASLYGGPHVGTANILRAYWRRFSALRRRMQYDLVWLEKEALPWLPTWMDIARLEGLPYVVDYDDAWFHRYEHHWLNPLLGQKIDAVMRVAHTVVAGNDYLARRAHKAGARHVEIVPTAVDLDRYRDLSTTRWGKGLTIGWIGIPLNAHYLKLIDSPLRAASRNVSLELHVVGAPVPAEFEGIPARSFSWTENSEISHIAEFDIGVMPLHDTPWERGKCAYKLLQVMAAGKPVIASPVGTNRQVVRHGLNGFLARMGAEARRTVEERYSTAVVTPRLAEILQKAAQF